MVKIASKKVKIWDKHDAELVLPQQSASLQSFLMLMGACPIDHKHAMHLDPEI
jgi:hypothetical protein